MDLMTGSAARPQVAAPPEAGGEEGFDYMIEPYNALRYARGNELRAMEYYRGVANEATDAEVKRLADEFAALEGSDKVDEELAEMKRALGIGGKSDKQEG